MAKKYFSLIIPAYNEEKNIDKILSVLNKFKRSSFELIVVADGSSDNTAKIASKFADKVLFNKNKRGKGHALWRGFLASKSDIIVMMDADLSHSPDNMWKMVNLLKSNDNIGMVIGSRRLGGSEDHTFIREIGNKILTETGNLFLNVKLTDMLNGYKVFRRSLITDVPLRRSNGFEIEIELIIRILLHGKSVVEIPDKEFARAEGVSNLNSVIDGSRILFKIISGGVRLFLKNLRR